MGGGGGGGDSLCKQEARAPACCLPLCWGHGVRPVTPVSAFPASLLRAGRLGPRPLRWTGGGPSRARQPDQGLLGRCPGALGEQEAEDCRDQAQVGTVPRAEAPGGCERGRGRRWWWGGTASGTNPRLAPSLTL